MVGPLRGGEVITTSCSDTSSAKETPLGKDTQVWATDSTNQKVEEVEGLKVSPCKRNPLQTITKA